MYEAKLLPNVIIPPPTLRPDDMRFAPPGSYRPQVNNDIIMTSYYII